MNNFSLCLRFFNGRLKILEQRICMKTIAETQTYNWWFKRFKNGRTIVDYAARSGTTINQIIPEHVAPVRSAVVNNRRQTIQNIFTFWHTSAHFSGKIVYQKNSGKVCLFATA